ncbi:MAG: pyrroline-5-carboxylate reductase [Candidatus Delongbacteria bacterium]|nr:pyrroline-5-carboxylate reductase [Candidatus Delongbacteria bacterium]
MPERLKGRIVIIGFGNMGKALARGIQNVTQAELYACEKMRGMDNGAFPEGLDINRIKLLVENDIPTLGHTMRLTSQDTIILCVKPQNLIEAGEKWSEVLIGSGSEKPLVISILAGTPTELIHQYFAGDCPVVRAMPNIAAVVDCAATAISGSPSTPESFVQRAKLIFDCIGKTWIIQEDLLNAVTGLSGSGPAYIYMVIEALSDGGVKMGIPRQLSLDLAAQTVLGAAKLVQETKLHPAILRDQVTTPGGTTISAIHELEKHGLRPMLISAVVTATEHSAVLAERIRKKIDELHHQKQRP